jgi:hypothetical protein
MNERKQITIRSVKNTTYAKLQDVKSTSHIPLGPLLDKAVEFWFSPTRGKRNSAGGGYDLLDQGAQGLQH